MNESDGQPVEFKVLSLEDSDLDFEIISEQLIKTGYNLNITRAIMEKEFTFLIQNNYYDIILADYQLPQFDAFEALKLCNKYCPEIPFICVSGSIGEITAVELLKMGAVDYVIKDRLERLPFAIKRAIDEAKATITRRQIEESLHQSEEKYRSIFENVQDVFYQTNLEGIIKEISPSIKHLLDFNAVDLIGKPVTEIYENPDDRKKLIQILGKKHEVRDYIIRLKSKGGEIKYVSTNARLIFTSEGVPDHIDGALRDITPRKLAEESLKRNEQRLRDIILSSADWVWEVDENGRYTYSSQRDIDLFGFTHDEIIGKTPFDFMPTEEANRVAAIFSEIAANKMPIKDLENWNIGKEGKLICLSTNGVPILDDGGNLKGYRGVDKNITERKNAEQELIAAKEKAEASDRLKTSFLNNISHEIRTPLNGILGFGQILTDQNLSQEEKEEYLNILNKSGERLINTVTSFIDISMISSGNQQVNKQDVYLESVLDIVIKSYSDICKTKKIDLLLASPDINANTRLFTDDVLLSKALHHLVDNAVKFTTKGSVVVGCQILDKEFHFYVKDTGIGISVENQQNIFKNFVQEEISYNRGYDGCGLGLSIATGMIGLLDGRIWMESEKGIGSTFHFTIPS